MKKEYLIYKLSEDLKEATRIENELFKKFDVKRGLRNEDGTGVLVGLTKIGNVVGYERIPGGGLKPIPGKLFYRGYDLEDLAHAILKEKRFGFEEVAYLLLSGRLPDYMDRMGALAGEGTLDQKRAAALISDKAKSLPPGVDFSAAIRMP